MEGHDARVVASVRQDRELGRCDRSIPDPDALGARGTRRQEREDGECGEREGALDGEPKPERS